MKMIENFILCIKNKSKKPICSAIDGIKNVKIALKSNE